MVSFNPLRKRFSRRFVLGGMALLATAAPLNHVFAADPQYGGTLKIATLGLDTSDPHRHTGSIGVQQVYVEALTSISNDGSVKPFLAKSFSVSDDGRTYTFKLRKGVKFHNGRAMTAKDVLKNFGRVKENVSKGWLASAMKQVESFEAPDSETFVVTMGEPYAAFLSLISELWIMAPESEGWDGTISKPIGTGPFKFGTWSPKVELIAPKNEDYWQEKLPYLDAVRFDLRDSADNDLALRSGDLHVAQVSRDKVSSLESDPSLGVQSLRDTTWYFLSYNNRKPNPPLDNPRVREAIAYAMDKGAYMDFVAQGQGVVTNQMVIPGNFYFDDALNAKDRHTKPNLEKAKKILAEEGVKAEDITLKFISYQSEPEAQVAVQMVKKLGFKVKHDALDDLGMQKRLGEYDWDLTASSSGPRADVFLRYVRMMSDGPNPVLWGGVQDAGYDKMVTSAITENDPGKRRKHYLDAWKHVMEKYYTLVLGHATKPLGVRIEVKGYEAGYTYSQNRVDGGLAYTWLAK